jgi:hypothetical protein
LFSILDFIKRDWPQVFGKIHDHLQIVNLMIFRRTFSSMYLWKSRIIEAFLRLVTVRLIFLTKVESLIEQEDVDVGENNGDVIYYFSP